LSDPYGKIQTLAVTESMCRKMADNCRAIRKGVSKELEII
jgi:hypothetical protein